MDLFEVNGVVDSQNIRVNDKDLQSALESFKSAVDEAQQDDFKKSTLRQPPVADDQPDFFVPSLYDVPVKDDLDLMEVAVFRLAKRQGSVNKLRFDLKNAVVEVTGSSENGLATIYDYDLVIMMVSHLAEEIRRHRKEGGLKPTNKFRPHSTEIFKFCRTSIGGNQYDQLEAALERLQGTYIKYTPKRGSRRRSDLFPLIAGARIVSETDKGRVGLLEITIPDWLYNGVVNHKNPEILTMNPDYFLIRTGLGRFVYRLARKAAGAGEAFYSAKTVHMRSGSTREFKKFLHDLRKLIRANDLPDYVLTEEKGKDGPVLRMTARAAIAN